MHTIVSNPEHVKVLQQGVEAWNRWYSVQRLIRDIDLSGVDLHETNLRAINFQGVNLLKADLRGANLQEADLRRARLIVANLQGANLKGANLRETDFRGANLREVNLLGAQALSANFSEAVVTGACIENWAINHNTNFEGTICFYVYLKAHQRERYPSQGFFRHGEWATFCEQKRVPVDFLVEDNRL